MARVNTYSFPYIIYTCISTPHSLSALACSDSLGQLHVNTVQIHVHVDTFLTHVINLHGLVDDINYTNKKKISAN